MIEAKDLRKSYESKEALRGISLKISDGEIYGLLGPNGAGKTTAISILSSILIPDSGSIFINGFNLKTQSKQAKQIVGVVPQEIALYEDLSAWENLMFWGGLYSLNKKTLKERAEEMLHLVGLSDRKNDAIKTYSGGMKRRINIASSLLHRPRILFMDEPTVGIDPQSRNLIFEVVELLHKEGMTIIYTTHYMEEAERLCDRIGIIDNGQIIIEGTLDELKKSSKIKESIIIKFDNSGQNIGEKVNTFWKDWNQDGDLFYFHTADTKTDLPRLVIKCEELGMDISGIELQKTNLETIFLNLTGKKLRD